MADEAKKLDRFRTLYEGEAEWMKRYNALKEHGYVLRPRYRPGWTPSWSPDEQFPITRHEDAISSASANRLDAERVLDGQAVFLKLAPKSSPEIAIGRLLASPELIKDPRNRCAPLLDVIDDPLSVDRAILVFPLLRRVGFPRPTTLGAYGSMITQTLETLAFLHENEIAHRDCANDNMMMDARPLYPRGWHPESLLRARDYPDRLPSVSPNVLDDVTYYFIDFGLSTHRQQLTVGMDGQERAPELSETTPYDPYKLDVYDLGMAYRRFLRATYRPEDVKYFHPITEFMTPTDPSERPTAQEAYDRFRSIMESIPQEILTKRLAPADEESLVDKLWNDLDHFVWTKVLGRWVKKRTPETLFSIFDV